MQFNPPQLPPKSTPWLQAFIRYLLQLFPNIVSSQEPTTQILERAPGGQIVSFTYNDSNRFIATPQGNFSSNVFAYLSDISSSITGPTGPLGGPSGPTGPTGHQGAASSVAGPTGPTGLGATGPQGTTGPSGGPTGPTGSGNALNTASLRAFSANYG